MNEIRLKNFRCFREEQRVRLAPLTLLVGENSTGKTSFMAMVRILSDMAYRSMNPDFKEDPYDLGSFDEIAHHRGGRGGRADTFEAGFSIKPRRRGGATSRFEFTFGEEATTPVPVRLRRSLGRTWVDMALKSGGSHKLIAGTRNGTWEAREISALSASFLSAAKLVVLQLFLGGPEPGKGVALAPLEGSMTPSSKDVALLSKLDEPELQSHARRPFASAPVRSKPRRTYDPARQTPDSEGDYVPMYLADVFSKDEQSSSDLKDQLEGFGRSSGLFDEISIRRLGKRSSEPFQVQVRKFGGGLKGPQRNLIDVGYGVSQVLPVITELLREDAPDMFLLQQPEVHLHPSAQAALGSLFCEVAGPNRQLVIETHSDYLMDRVRMNVRDGKSKLKPEDVSILFFERDALDVNIHSLRIDDAGNIVGAPDSYRRFFMEETAKSLGLPV